MLETLRAYGAGLLAEAGEQARAAAALAGYALRVAEQAAAGLQTSTGEVAAARRLDAEDATMRQALAWAMDHDRGRRAAAGGRAGAVVVPARPGGRPSTRCCARPPGAPPRAATGGAPRSSGSAGRRCTRPIWPGRWATSPRSATPSRDRGPSRALADCLAGRSVALREPGPDRRGGRGRPPLAGPGPGARLPGRGGAGPGGASASPLLTPATWTAPCGWPGRPSRSRPTSPAGSPGSCSYALTDVLIEAGDLAAAERRLRGGAGPVPGRGRPAEPGEAC